MSLSARRVWIEIPAGGRKELRGGSLSARRVWIEIFDGSANIDAVIVTLCEESVD